MYILYTIYDILTGKDLGILLSYQFSIDGSYAEEIIEVYELLMDRQRV